MAERVEVGSTMYVGKKVRLTGAIIKAALEDRTTIICKDAGVHFGWDIDDVELESVAEQLNEVLGL